MGHLDLLEFFIKCEKENIHSSTHRLGSFLQGYAVREYYRLDNIENFIKFVKYLDRRI